MGVGENLGHFKERMHVVSDGIAIEVTSHEIMDAAPIGTVLAEINSNSTTRYRKVAPTTGGLTWTSRTDGVGQYLATAFGLRQWQIISIGGETV